MSNGFVESTCSSTSRGVPMKTILWFGFILKKKRWKMTCKSSKRNFKNRISMSSLSPSKVFPQRITFPTNGIANFGVVISVPWIHTLNQNLEKILTTKKLKLFIYVVRNYLMTQIENAEPLNWCLLFNVICLCVFNIGCSVYS